jgi:hypothetical protein
MAKRYEELILNHKVYLLDKYIGHWPQMEDKEKMIYNYFKFINKLDNKVIYNHSPT